MKINQEDFSKLLEKLEGLDWCFFSGLAVKLYTNKERDCKDIDIMLKGRDLNEFAERIGAEVKRRTPDKRDDDVNDLGFETKFRNLDVEATSGFPRNRFREGLTYKIFKNSVKKGFLGEDVYLTPIEELIVHKASMFREKDKKDLKDLKTKDFQTDFIKELAEDWGEREKIFKNLREIGFEI